MEENHVIASISTRYEELKEQNLNYSVLEDTMKEEFENDVDNMLAKKNYELQGEVYLTEGNYDFEWIVYDVVIDTATGNRVSRIDTGYTFLPESELLVPHDEA